MPPKSHYRGHEVTWHDGDWHYSDTAKKADYDRPCVRCGRMPTTEGFDACLGFIIGAEHACCGHGVNEPIVKIRRLI